MGFMPKPKKTPKIFRVFSPQFFDRLYGRQDTRDNDIHPNDTQHNNKKIETQHYGISLLMPIVIILCVKIDAVCHN
jgi:hypothetical protein